MKESLQISVLILVDEIHTNANRPTNSLIHDMHLLIELNIFVTIHALCGENFLCVMETDLILFAVETCEH
jgi:hypothetical protein